MVGDASGILTAQSRAMFTQIPMSKGIEGVGDVHVFLVQINRYDMRQWSFAMKSNLLCQSVPLNSSSFPDLLAIPPHF